MKAQHTPGPWKYSNDTKMVFSLDENGMDSKGICSVNENNAKEHGKLIAAAPYMLEELEAALEKMTKLGLMAITRERIRAAIKKATE